MSLVTVDDFSTYLGNPDLDQVRAQFILDRAEELCLSIVSPLPDTATSVVLDVAQRAFAVPTAEQDQALGLYSEGVGPFGGTPGASGGGLWLTENNIRTLRRLAGQGGAFTVDTLPAGFTPTLPYWDTGAGWTGDWDSPA